MHGFLRSPLAMSRKSHFTFLAFVILGKAQDASQCSSVGALFMLIIAQQTLLHDAPVEIGGSATSSAAIRGSL
jgi:hypothetical protein